MPVWRYLHFLLALGVALGMSFPLGGYLAFAVNGFDDRVGLDEVLEVATWSSLTAALVFWAVGRWRPLRASFARTLAVAAVALLVVLILARTAARTTWLTGDGAAYIFLLGMAALGYLPFRRPHEPARPLSPPGA